MATKRAPRAKKAERKLNVLQIGNFSEHSTETHLKRALEHNGHNVCYAQEDKHRGWDALATIDNPEDADLVIWTRTGWDYTHPNHGAYSSQQEPLDLQRQFLARMRGAGVPTVAYHLDLFADLNPGRQAIVDEPFFDCDLAVTADGGSDEWFAEHDVNHVWFPPGVSLAETEIGMYRDKYASPIVFVGSWQGHYHRESEHRFQLVDFLQRHFKESCAFYPQAGFPAVRGEDLRDLYASVKVAVGDSCLVGTGHARYVSDRLPESTGRGAYLLHPDVEGVTDGTEWRYGPTWCGGDHLGTWAAGDWDDLGAHIEWALANPSNRREVAAAGKAHTVEHHSYERRMQQLVQLLHDEGLLRGGV